MAKRFIAAILAVMTVVSAMAITVSAKEYYYEDFENVMLALKKVATEIGSTALDGVISIGVEWGKSAFGNKIYEYLR